MKLIALMLGLAMASAAQAAPDPTVAHADYADPALWLCRPDKATDACKVDLDATVIASNGKTTVEKFRPAKSPTIDCFFVYPTVSMDPGWQSDFDADHMETDDIRLQFARFGAVCRTFAPIYRQGTLTGLRVASGGAPPKGPRPPAGVGGYADVVDAWNWYLTHENKRRGVVLIGHSQGAGIVARLLAAEVDKKPAQRRLVSAIVLGSTILVPPGRDVGGTLKSIPLCRNEKQIGCVITYSSFRDTNPPPAESRFAKGRDGLTAGCTNPANLTGVEAVRNESYFLAKGFLNSSGGTAQPDWATPAPDIKTPFVKVVGLVTTTCKSMGDFRFLSVRVNANPRDARTDTLGGEIIRPTGPDWSWGLHLIDVDHSLGNLVAIVATQARAFELGGLQGSPGSLEQPSERLEGSP